MSNTLITKNAIAAAMKELMQHTPFDKISVNDITKLCGINRNTFYYHFHDKYDLIVWILRSETAEYLQTVKYGVNWTEGILNLCLYIERNHKFYRNALNHIGQYALNDYLVKFIKETILEFISNLPDKRVTSADEIEFIAVFYASAFAGLIMLWATGQLTAKPEEHVKHIEELIYKGLINALT